MFFQKRILIISFFICLIIPFSFLSGGAKLPPELIKAIKDGKTEKAIELAGDVVFSANDPSDGAHANVIVAILVFLEADPEAATRALSISDFYTGSKHKEEKNAILLLSYLAGKTSEKKFFQSIKDKSPDWQATAEIGRYVKILKEEGIQAKKLNECVRSYMSLSEKLGNDSWGNVWKARLVGWHNSLQDKADKGSGLEKLIFQVKDDLSAGPLKAQLASVGNIIELLLKENKSGATAVIKKSLGGISNKKSDDNKGYVALLNYLSGKNVKVQEVYKSCQSSSDLFIMVGASVFVKDLSKAESGKIRKTSLLVHLDNYTRNLKNSERESVQKWKNKVDSWKQWCKGDFPLKSGLDPLMRRHSKAFAEQNKDKIELQSALKLYAKLKYSRSLKSVSSSDFKKSRAIYRKRPMPDNMDFTKPEIKAYLNTLPADTRQGEWERIRYLIRFVDNMAGVLNHTRYSGSIKTKSRTVRGKVMEANENGISVKAGSRTKKYKWTDIKPEQFLAFSQDYIKNFAGAKVKGKDNIFVLGTDADKTLAEHYRLLTLFFDWYGMYPEALKYGKLASELKKHDRGSTRQLLLN